MEGAKELAKAEVLEVPTRWVLPVRNVTRAECLKELRTLGEHFQKGLEGLGSLYLRITDHIRHYELTAEEVRATFKPVGFQDSRISELLRVATAPETIYREYSARLVGFRIALKKTRMFYMVGRNQPRYRRRQLQRAAVRLVKRLRENNLSEWQFNYGGLQIVAHDELNITYIVRL
ncbi:MAG TPA: hypothetical protein DCY13_07675 [Verrucomicrobiales bacterium]|jgi:hypothetical protein|nr:hypothetical protein [Verrucomicrobiales bacterium]